MANATINDLPFKSGALAGNEKLEIDDGASKSVTAQQIADLADRSGLTALTIAAGVVNVDLALGSYFTLALTAPVTSITFSNLPPTGHGRSIAIRVQQDATGSRTMSLPASFKPTVGSDTSVQSPANSYTLLIATTFDQGGRWEYSMKGVSA